MAHPGQQISLPNSPTPNPQTAYQLVSGVADPFSLRYRPLLRGGNVTVNSPVDFGLGGPGVVARDFPPQDGTLGGAPPSFFQNGMTVTPTLVNNINNGNPLLSCSPYRSTEWWHLTIWGQELIRQIGTDPDFSGQVAVRGSQQVTMLKARITWTEFPAQRRQIIADIGTGLDIFIGPTNQVFAIEIMVPDVVSAPALRPGVFTTDGGDDPSDAPPRFRYDAFLVASAWCVYGSRGSPAGTFTQSAFIVTADDTQNRVLVDIPDNARTVQVFSSQASGNNPVIWGFETAPPPGSLELVTASLGQTDFNGSQTGRVFVPQTAKFLFLTAPDNAETLMTAVFRGQQ